MEGFLVQVKIVENGYRLIRTERILEGTSWSPDDDGSNEASSWKDNVDWREEYIAWFGLARCLKSRKQHRDSRRSQDEPIEVDRLRNTNSARRKRVKQDHAN